MTTPNVTFPLPPPPPPEDGLEPYSSPTLPHGWKVLIERRSGKRYYHNVINNETQWNRPLGPGDYCAPRRDSSLSDDEAFAGTQQDTSNSKSSPSNNATTATAGNKAACTTRAPSISSDKKLERKLRKELKIIECSKNVTTASGGSKVLPVEVEDTSNKNSTEPVVFSTPSRASSCQPNKASYVASSPSVEAKMLKQADPPPPPTPQGRVLDYPTTPTGTNKAFYVASPTQQAQYKILDQVSSHKNSQSIGQPELQGACSPHLRTTSKGVSPGSPPVCSSRSVASAVQGTIRPPAAPTSHSVASVMPSTIRPPASVSSSSVASVLPGTIKPPVSSPSLTTSEC